MPKCRICWEEERPKISPCSCSGSMAYIHEECLKLWISKSIERGSQSAVSKENGYSSINCELCKTEIVFKMQREPGCLKKEEVKERIK